MQRLKNREGGSYTKHTKNLTTPPGPAAANISIFYGGIGVIPLHKTNRKGKPVFQDLPWCYAFRLLVGRCILHLRYPKGCVGNHFRPQQPIVYYVITIVIIPYFFTFVKFAMLLNSKRL